MSEYNAANPEHVAKAEKAFLDQLDDLQHVLQSERGRRFIYSLCYSLDTPSYVPNDMFATAYNEGSRAVGRDLLERVRQISPKMFIKMHEEFHFDG